jgi:hypothetical protein
MMRLKLTGLFFVVLILSVCYCFSGRMCKPTPLAKETADEVRPELWGAKVNDGIDDSTAIKQAILAANGRPVCSVPGPI